MKKSTIIYSCIFAGVELGLLVAVMLTDGILNRTLSFSSIVLAFAFSFIFFNLKEKTYLTHFALFFTMMADLFLVVVSPQMKELAMLSFSITQILYFVRLMFVTNNKKANIIHSIVRASVVVLVLVVTAIVLQEKTDFLSIISMFYYANLIMNLITAFIYFKNNPLFALGLIFFIICDTFVGLQVAVGSGYIFVKEATLLYRMIFPPFNIVWLCYIPSQTLITLSLMKPLNASKKG